METKKAILRNSKERILSLGHLSFEFVWFMKAKVYIVESCTVYVALNFHTNSSISTQGSRTPFINSLGKYWTDLVHSFPIPEVKHLSTLIITLDH